MQKIIVSTVDEIVKVGDASGWVEPPQTINVVHVASKRGGA